MIWPQGIEARRAEPADVAAVTALIACAEREDVGEALINAEDVAAGWREPGFDLERDVRLLYRGGLLVGYARVFAGRAHAWVAPDARGQAVGTALLEWTEGRAREQASSAADARVGQTVCDRARDAVDLLRAHGYEPTYTSWILRLPPDARPEMSVPQGVRIRPMRAGEERAVFELIERAFNEWPGRKPSTFARWSTQWVEREDFDPRLLLVAEYAVEPASLAGAVLAYDFPEEGWVQQLAVEPRCRGRGLGRALLASVCMELRARGQQRLGLNTDSRTGALGLYTRLGMHVAISFTHYAKALD
jgi:mycothiol synthase